MWKTLKRNKLGLTLVELMIAIAVIAVISSFFALNIQNNDMQDEVTEATNELFSDLRYIRNLAVSRTTYDFDGAGGEDPIYPPGGYGIYVDSQSGGPSTYTLYADNGSAAGYNIGQDASLKEVAIASSDVQISNATISKYNFYFAYLSESEVETNMGWDTYDRHRMIVRDSGPGYPDKGYQGYINLGERSEENEGIITWGNIGMTLGEYTPSAPAPVPGGCGKTCPEMSTL